MSKYSDLSFASERSRRRFLQTGALLIAGAGTAQAQTQGEEPMLRIGLMTDLHYADKKPAGSRYYRETLAKIAEASGQLAKARLDFLVELGDFIDAADAVDVELRYLKTIAKPFAEICHERHHVLGNHCVDTLTKEEFLGTVEQEKSYYSFDRGGYHFVVLDACFRSDGKPYGRNNSKWTDANIPPDELEWLADDLKQSNKSTIVFAHQRLDYEGNHAVNNSPAVRKIFEESGNVTTVFQGHSHANDYRQVNGVHYCTLRAMIEDSGLANSGFAILEIDTRGGLKIEGFQKQVSYQWT
ncbi:metallophosphoesterase family protein [Bremerella alba]|uniref:3',5'-cyclic adenosine monophosphate phosphodiesterase CpdA n=1 Tax=Bremerella alba TaxID=980252 RepID=A0A7V8V3F9_9BACT|nr:metallophosphoesterase [Bremerella alba]MBA2114228.1 3',5'-cyclic adenosine monophosphate phosphodiesterase CpdA [Bremerella alba]